MKGDAIFIKKVNQDELKINDIISFHNKDEIITHRIVKVIEENGKTKYITKGDNNRREDKEHITYEKNRRGISIQNIWIWKNSRTIKR